tara:strand:+ start:797 stop:1207 length:411 start_codon:yes stop_codon:yes gene_type:complete
LRDYNLSKIEKFILDNTMFKMESIKFITYKYKKLDGTIRYISVNPDKSLFYDNYNEQNPIEYSNIPQSNHTHVNVFDVENNSHKTLILENIMAISHSHDLHQNISFDSVDYVGFFMLGISLGISIYIFVIFSIYNL